MRASRLLITATVVCAAQTAGAAPVLRVRQMVNGDVLVVGSPLAHDCGSAPTPAGASALCTGVFDSDAGSDAYWRDGTADATVSATSARTSADLPLPAAARVKYARLYWSATLDAASPDLGAVLDRPGGFSTPVTADSSFMALIAGPLPLLSYIAYQASADVTALVAAHGRGAYRVSDVAGIGLDGVSSEVSFAAWTLVVIYELPASPPHLIALYDGLDGVTRNTPVALTADGFAAPAGSVTAKLGVWALSGRSAVAGDSLRVNGAAISTADNPADNFFNRSRTFLGAPVASLVPAFTGQAGTASGYDLDVVDIGALVRPGDSSIGVNVSTGDDAFWLGGMVFSMRMMAPADAGAPLPVDAAPAADTAVAADSGRADLAPLGPPPPPPPDAGADLAWAVDGGGPMRGDDVGGAPPTPEVFTTDGGARLDTRAMTSATAGDGPAARATGLVAEGSGCRCQLDRGAPPPPLVAVVIAIVLAGRSRSRRRSRGGV